MGFIKTAVFIIYAAPNLYCQMKRILPAFTLLLTLFGVVTVVSGQELLINEVMSDNDLTITDGFGEYSDWIELYNPGTVPVFLGDYHLADDPDDLMEWRLPDIELESGGFFLLFASDRDTVILPHHWHSIISQGDEWRYLPGKEEPSPSWKQIVYDDSGWQTGKAGIGYGDGDDSTVIAPTLSLYCRKSFVIDDTASIEEVILDIDYDDGFVAYLNGVEIARANLDGDPPAFDQKAGPFTEPMIPQGGRPARFELPDHKAALLRKGINLLAVQVHNSDSTSSDLSFVPFLSIAFGKSVPGRRQVPLLELESHDGLYHSNFKISSAGEHLYLSDETGTLLHVVDSVGLKGDHSYGRDTDGADTWKVFHQPSPGSSNNSSNALFYSHKRGFHREPFWLKIRSEREMPVYYTLDGSMPDENSLRFPDSLFVGYRDQEPNVISLIPTTQPPPVDVIKHWEPPLAPTEKATVIKCRSFLNGIPTTPVYSATYFVDPLGSDRYTLPVFSLITDSLNLFDYDSGIFVPGVFADPANNRTGNYFQRGIEWERPVHIEYFEQEGDVAFAQNGGLRIHGQYSRRAAQKSLRLYARNEYGKKYFAYRLFPKKDHESYKRLVLRSSMTTFDTRFGDAFIADMARDLDFEIQDFQPVILFVNGAYFGIHNMREYIDEHFIQSLYPEMDEDSLNILRMKWTIMEGNNQDYRQLYEFIRTNSLAVPENFDYVTSRIDYANYLDYCATEIYLANRDWPGNNVIYWQSQRDGSKWRWILNDLDASFRFPHLDMIAQATDSTSTRWPNPEWSTLIFRRMLANEQFRTDYICRSMELMRSVFHPDRIISRMEGYKQLYVPEIDEHILRWNFPESNQKWVTFYDSTMVRFANTRPVYFMKHLTDAFGISVEEINEMCPCCEPGPPLEVEFTNPMQGQFLAHPAAITVEAEQVSGSEDVRMSLFLDGKFLSTLYESPFQWDSSGCKELAGISTGDHTLEVLAFETTGFSTAYATTSFSVIHSTVGDHILLGDTATSVWSGDTWTSNLVVNETDTFTNRTDSTLRLRVEEFSFRAIAEADPVTPFVVRVNGNDDFTVLAVGDTRSAGVYGAGLNHFPFRDSGDTILMLAPGETVASGFLDAFPDGSGGGLGSVIPFNEVEPADEVWYSGSPSLYRSGSVTEGQPPFIKVPARDYYRRNYLYQVGMTIADSLEIVTDAPGHRERMQFTIYPNPVSGNYVHIHMDRNKGPVLVTVYDLHGRVLVRERFQPGQIRLETKYMTHPGTYLVRLESDGQVQFGKLIKTAR